MTHISVTWPQRVHLVREYFLIKNHMISLHFYTSIQSILLKSCMLFSPSLYWRHNERDGVWNQRRLHCLLIFFFRRKSKKTSNSASVAFVRGIHRWPVNSPHKGPVTRKMFPFDDVIMIFEIIMADSDLLIIDIMPAKDIATQGRCLYFWHITWGEWKKQ